MSIRRVMMAAAALGVLGTGVAQALTPSSPANFGEVNLNAGFQPDPHTVNVVAGGGIDAGTQGLPANCRGFVTDAPDYKLNYSAGNFDLFISVIAQADTTLIINDPSGNWICDDDGGTDLNPLIAFDNPQSGRYDIWVGTYSQGNQSATLYISEFATAGAGAGGGAPPPPPPPPPPAAGLNPNLAPNFGTTTIQAGLPYTQQLLAGGGIQASTANPSCTGYATAAPDLAVNFQTIAGILPLVISVTSNADTTLIVFDPAGNWRCNDDTNGLNPEVRIDGPQGGLYRIWVGTFTPGNTPDATLTVSYGLGGKT